MNPQASSGRMDEDDAGRLDADAVARTLSGDLTAFDGLIEKYQRRAVSVSYRLLGNVNDAMDVCQEAFLKAFRSLASLQQPERFGAWLMRIVTNLSLNYRRNRHPALSLATDDDEAGIHEGAAAEHDPRTRQTSADPLLSAEVHEAITAAIEALPEPRRLALVLFAIEGLSQKEVAEILGCSVEMVKWNVFQARKTLKKRLSDYLES